MEICMSEPVLLLDKEYLWNKKSAYIWVLDAGHSGMDEKGYRTAPAKMHKFPEFTIYEGVINREITYLVRDQLKAVNIDYAFVFDPIEDTTLQQRVNTADAIYAKDKRAIYLSIHSNAGGGSGFEIFTSPGQSKSDKIANIFIDRYQRNFPDHKFRSDKADGDADKEADFFVLRKTDCPAVLVENLFFDNKKEAEFLLSKEGQAQIAKAIYMSILACEQLKPI
jgi:N-acetylmuramoyl-L-alanine amidase